MPLRVEEITEEVHPAQPGIVFNLAGIERHLGWRWWRRNCRITEPLMGAHGVVVALVFPDQMLQMVFPEHDEMVEAFLLYTLNEPFRERVQVDRLPRRLARAA